MSMREYQHGDAMVADRDLWAQGMRAALRVWGLKSGCRRGSSSMLGHIRH